MLKEKYSNRVVLKALLPFNIIENLDEVLKSWFNSNDDRKELAKELFYNGLIKKNETPKATFLELIQALEGLSVINKQKYYIDPASGIIDEIQNDFKNLLDQKGIASNLATPFWKRIPDLNSKITMTNLLKKFLFEEIDKEILEKLKIDDKYIKSMADIRHSFSHNKGKKLKSINAYDLKIMINKMIIILIYYFAIDNKISCEIVKNAIFKSNSWIGSFIKFLNEENNI